MPTATTHDRYASTVSATDDARRAQHDLNGVQRRADDLRTRRDQAIWEAWAVDGVAASRLARELGLSKSAVIAVLRIQRARQQS